MKITSVTYSRTRNLGNFESVKIEATVEVESPDPGARDSAYEGLRDWVLGKLADTSSHNKTTRGRAS